MTDHPLFSECLWPAASQILPSLVCSTAQLPQNTPAPASPSAFQGLGTISRGFSTHCSLLCKTQCNQEKPPQCQRLREGFRSALASPGLPGAVLGLSPALKNTFLFIHDWNHGVCELQGKNGQPCTQGERCSEWEVPWALTLLAAGFCTDMVTPGTSAVPWWRDNRLTESQLFLFKAPPLSYTLFKLQLKPIVFIPQILGKAALPNRQNPTSSFAP